MKTILALFAIALFSEAASAQNKESAEEKIMVPFDNGSGIVQALTVSAAIVFEGNPGPYGPWRCQSSWCISFEMSRYGTGDIPAKSQPNIDAKFQFDMGGLCDGKPKQWTWTEARTLAYSSHIDDWFPIDDSNCTVDMMKVSFVAAWDSNLAVPVAAQKEPKPKADFTDKLKALQAQRDAHVRQSNAARQKRELEERANAAEQARLARERCMAIYTATIDKKVRDLTVREEEQVGACQALKLYPPP